jgi:hypothetical protein
MRTKTLLLTAALCAAGVATSLAQSVYSVNAVGYVNLTIVPGYNLIANPLNGTNNNINTIIPVAPADTEAFGWNNASQQFAGSDTYFEGLGWLDSAFTPSTTVFNPGLAFFVRNAGVTNFTLTFVGDVPQGALTNNILPNYGFYSSIVPQSAGLSTIGFPGVPDIEYTVWNPAVQQYGATYTFIGVQPGYPTGWADSGFNPVDPTPAVGQGFIIRNPNPTTYPWGRNFNVNN